LSPVKGQHLRLIYREATNTTSDQAWSDEQVLMTGPAIGTTVVDEGVAGPERFKRAVYWAGEGRKRGLYLQTSSDGKDWNFTTSNPILARTDDIVDLWKDPRTGTYGLFIKHMVNDKRETMLSHSSDFVKWSKPVTVFQSDSHDQGVTELDQVGRVKQSPSLFEKPLLFGRGNDAGHAFSQAQRFVHVAFGRILQNENACSKDLHEVAHLLRSS
jgi:hypothetical protein